MEQHAAEPAFTTSRAVGPGGPSAPAREGDGAAPPALAARALTKSYHAGISGCSARVQALRGIDLRIEQGEAVGILGPAGSGKSTLMLCLAGMLQPDRGSISWFGRLADEGGPPPGIAYVSHYRAAYPFMTVREAIEFQATLRDTALADRPGAVEAALEETGLGAEAGALVGTISNASATRVALAGALAGQPRVVLLDETLSGLLPSERRALAVVVRRLMDRAVTIVIGADELHAMDGLVTRIAVMLEGAIATTVAPSLLRRSRMLELTVAAPGEGGRPVGTRVAETDLEHRTLRLPLEGTSAEAILARCRACDIRVITSRVIIAHEPPGDPG